MVGGVTTAVRAGSALLTGQARFLQVLADPTRLAVLAALAQGERSVAELVDALGVPRSRLSNHLACLRWCEFVQARRRGRHVVYRLRDERLPGLLAAAADLAARTRSPHPASRPDRSHTANDGR